MEDSSSEISSTSPITTQNSEDKSDEKKKKKPFVERVGDWVCIKCKNLNFSFRMVCNRCQLSKIESEKLFEQYMCNLMKYAKFNEMIQNKILSCRKNNDMENMVNSTGWAGNRYN